MRGRVRKSSAKTSRKQHLRDHNGSNWLSNDQKQKVGARESGKRKL